MLICYKKAVKWFKWEEKNGCIAKLEQTGTLDSRLGEEEKGRHMVTTCLLLSKASGQLQMIKKITFQFHSLSCQLSSSKLFAKARNERLCLLCRSYFCSYVCVFVCVCVVSQFDLSITKQNYLFVRCESLSHIPNTSLRCSNQPSWKLSLMTGLNTTKQQKGEIKNAI